jgi:hypothetical protein
MTANEQTRTTAGDAMPWWEVNPKTAPLWLRLAIPLHDIWYRLKRGTPEQSYERRREKRIVGGVPLRTLGVQIRDEAGTRAEAQRWLETLVKLGLRPEHLCVEYGCGSLWCAEPVIRHLLPDRFVGLDITDRFYEFGRQRLGDLLAEKRVRLAVMSRRFLREVATLKPDFVYSHRVLHHVPRRGLARYMRNIISMLSERTILVIENTPRLLPDGSLKGRRYSATDIEAYLPRNWHCRQESFGLVIKYGGDVMA